MSDPARPEQEIETRYARFLEVSRQIVSAGLAGEDVSALNEEADDLLQDLAHDVGVLLAARQSPSSPPDQHGWTLMQVIDSAWKAGYQQGFEESEDIKDAKHPARERADMDAVTKPLHVQLERLAARDAALAAQLPVYDDIRAERLRQDVQWGGPAHDDQHPPEDWLAYIEKQLDRAKDVIGDGPDSAYRERLVKIAALAVAAIDVVDRAHGTNGDE